MNTYLVSKGKIIRIHAEEEIDKIRKEITVKHRVPLIKELDTKEVVIYANRSRGMKLVRFLKHENVLTYLLGLNGFDCCNNKATLFSDNRLACSHCGKVIKVVD